MIGIASGSVPFVWDDIKPRIEDALTYGNGEYTPDDIYKALCGAGMQLWMTKRSLAITSSVAYPHRVTCLVVVAHGELDDLLRHLPTLEAWSVSEGCDGMEVLGREGWKRALEPMGYRQAQVHLRKDLGCTPSSEVH